MTRTLIAVACLALAAAPEALGATRNVDITRIGFSPSRIVVDPGDTVVWTNKDSSQHQVVADQGGFPASPVLQANQTYSFVFTRSGSHGYRDAFNQNERGTVVVREGVAIAAAARLVAFGAPAALSGAVSNGAAGEKVDILAQECGKTTLARVTTVTTGTSGAWSVAVKPALKTVYTARWKGNTSTPIEVSVAPRVVLTRLPGGRRFSARVSAAQSFVGKSVVLQRYSSARRRWLTVKTVVLRTQAAPPPTAVAAATFSSRVRRRTRLRLVMPASQVGPCYSAGASNVVRA